MDIRLALPRAAWLRTSKPGPKDFERRRWTRRRAPDRRPVFLDRRRQRARGRTDLPSGTHRETARAPLHIRRGRASAKSFLRLWISVGNVVAMGRVVLPRVAVNRRTVAIEEQESPSIDIDPMSAPIPLAPTPQRSNDGRDNPAAAEAAGCGSLEITWKIVGRIGRIRPRPIHDGRIASGKRHRAHAGRLDRDRLLLHRHDRLRPGAEMAGGCSPTTQTLDRIHHRGLVGKEGFAQSLGPIELAVHHAQYSRVRNDRLHARIPVLLLQRRRKLVALERGIMGILKPTDTLNHFERICRSHQDLGEKGVRVKRNGGQQLIELLRRQLRRGLVHRRVRRSRSLRRSRRHSRHEEDVGSGYCPCQSGLHLALPGSTSAPDIPRRPEAEVYLGCSPL